MSGPQPQAIVLSSTQEALLQALLRQSRCPQAVVLRAKIVLAAASQQRNEQIAHALQCSLPTVRKWRRRWAAAEAELAAVEHQPHDLRVLVANLLADAPRSGSPGTFSAEQIVQIINLACRAPSEFARPIDAWTPRELADEAVKQDIVVSISARSVGRFLKRGRAQASSKSLLAERQNQED